MHDQTVYAVNQPLRTTDAPTFAGATLTGLFYQADILDGASARAQWLYQLASTGYTTGNSSLIQQDLNYDCPTFLTKNGFFIDMEGDKWLGAHINMAATSDKSAGLAFGIHGTDQVGELIALDGASCYASRIFQYATGSTPIHEININRVVDVTSPVGAGSSSGTSYTGKPWRLLNNGTESYSVNYQGDVYSTGSFLSGAKRLGYNLAAYAAGTGYNLTDAQAALDFGTTDPSITLDAAGTYLLQAAVRLDRAVVNLTYGTTITLKLRRTNNTAADLANGSIAMNSGSLDTLVLSETMGHFNLPPVIYTTANTNDVVTIFGGMSAAPIAGNVTANALGTQIVAIRLY